jgi:hypothetical protein
MGHFAKDAFERFRYSFNTFLAERLRVLFATKHLYQKLSIAPDEIYAELNGNMVSVSGEKEEFAKSVDLFTRDRFTVTNKLLFDSNHKPIPCLVVGNVKLFCSKCDSREAFRPIWFSEITNELLQQYNNSGQQKFKIAFDTTFQLFYVVYQCQRCEGKPEVFLVKRDELDLSIEGRSPIEHVEIPNYIPKDERKWFRDAVIAFQTGKILAALFYLRTFIEQFGRRKTNLVDEKKTGDEIMTAYVETIPLNLRGMMPSLGEWYDKLSAAVHGAKEDPALFEAATKQIQKHFDIRRAHDLEE